MIKHNRKIFIILTIFIAAVLAAIFLIFSGTHKQKSKLPNLDSGRYYDSKSDQTVSDPNGKAPDTYGTSSDQPTYLGISNLVDSGLSDDQITRLKYAFYSYSIQSKKNIKEVSVEVRSISPGPHDPNGTSPFSLNFNVTFDRKDTYKAKVEYKGLEDIRLYLYNNKTNAQIYDSTPLGVDTTD